MKQIESWEAYIAEKNKKEDNKNAKKEPVAAEFKQETKITEKVFGNCPTQTILIDKETEEQLPIGWYLVYNNCFSKYNISK